MCISLSGRQFKFTVSQAVTFTFAVGAVASFTVYVWVLPCSISVNAVGDSVMPGFWAGTVMGAMMTSTVPGGPAGEEFVQPLQTSALLRARTPTT